MKVTALLADGPRERYYWRVELPFKYLNMFSEIKATTEMLGTEFEPDSDLYILPKLTISEQFVPVMKEYFEFLREDGAKIVYDIDDDMWSDEYIRYRVKMALEGALDVPDKEASYIVRSIHQQRKENLLLLREVDYVTASSEKLVDYIKTLVDVPVYLVPNAIDVSWFQMGLLPSEGYRHPHYKTIGWAGGSRPQSDLKNMLSAWDHIAANRNDVKFVLSGWQPKLDNYPHLTKDNTIHVGWLPMSTYMNTFQVDIGCVCVEGTEFCMRKTPIKAWEFALAGAMVVGSSCLYGEEPIPNCESTEDWIRTLTFYLDNEDARLEAAKVYHDFVTHYDDMFYNWMNWRDTYELMYQESKERASNNVSVFKPRETTNI